MKLSSALVGAGSTLLLASGAHAAGSSADAVAVSGGLMGLFAAGIALLAVASIVGIVFFILWLWALIDVLRRNFKNKKTKSTWTWLVALAWPLPVVLHALSFLAGFSFVIDLAGVVIVIVYLVSIRKQGTVKK